MLLTCSALELVSVRSPGIVLSSSSRMSVTVVSMTRGFAPRSTVVTETTGESTSGYSRTGRRRNASPPKSTSARLIMLASTGRRIAVSLSFTVAFLDGRETSVQSRHADPSTPVGGQTA